MQPVKIPPDLIEFEGLAPTGNSRRLIRLPRFRILDHFEKTCSRSIFEEAWWVPDVCSIPAGIWRDLKRRDQEEALCYAGVPSGEFASSRGKTIMIPAEKTLMVFLTPELEVTKWRLCEESPGEPGFPKGHATRFGERLWPPI